MQWTIEVTPKRRCLDINFKELWRYRDLYLMYIKRDIVVVYKQTILGPIWYLIQPMLTTAMFMFVFGGLAGISTDGVPQPLFYLAGLLIWNYFSAVFTGTSSVFLTHASIFGKVYFPRLVVPLAVATSNLLKFLIQLLLFVAVYIYFIVRGEANVSINYYVLMAPLLVVISGVLALSWGMIMSSMTTKYRDLTQLLSFGVQLLMYASPVIYPLSVASEDYRQILMLNPLSSVFEAFRYGLLGCGNVQWGWLGYSLAFTLVSLVIAVITFNKVERTFMDTI